MAKTKYYAAKEWHSLKHFCIMGSHYFLSSPSACLRSGASKNRFSVINGGHRIYVVLVVTLGDFLVDDFFDNFFDDFLNDFSNFM